MLGFSAILLSLSALFGYINHKLLKLPATIGVMLLSVLLGLTLKTLDTLQPETVVPVRVFLSGIDFSSFVLDFILCFLLFAGSLHVNIGELKGARATVFSYATLGVVISTVVIGIFTWLIASAFGFAINFTVCLLFGALISPTDPIAVMGILSKYKIPKKLKTEIIGESLFNDGVGVVVFTVVYALISGGEASFSIGNIFQVFAVEVVGGILLGLMIGYTGYRLLKSIDHYQTEILITLAMVTGGYSIASLLHTSGPLAMVVAGIFIGNEAKAHAMSDITAEYVDKFWELVDEICNIILFVLMGLEIFLVPFEPVYLAMGMCLIVSSIAARYISLLPAFFMFNRREPRKLLNLAVLTWSGLRGGISVALALSLSGKVQGSSMFIVATYCIVLFSILVQGLTVKRLLKKYEP